MSMPLADGHLQVVAAQRLRISRAAVIEGDPGLARSPPSGAEALLRRPAPPGARPPGPPPGGRGPRDCPGLLGGEVGRGSAERALAGGKVLEVHAGPGWGKSALLRHVCHVAAVPADGLVYLPCGGLQAED